MRYIATLALTFVMCLSVACQKTVTAPVPGQINTFDAYAYRALADAQAAINSFKTSPSAQVPAVKSVLNQAIQDYDIAETAYQAWHAAGGSGDTTNISVAIVKVQNDIAGIVQNGGK